MLLSSFIIERNITDDCSSKLDQRYSQRRDKKIAFKTIKYKFRASINKNSSLCTEKLVHCEGAIFRVAKFYSVCHAERFGILLAKGSDCITALMTCK